MSGTTIWDIAGLSVASAAITGFICYHASSIGRAIQVMDRPDGARKLHQKETPLIGGPAILVPALAISFLSYVTLSFAPIMFVALVATLAAFIIGLIDDRIALSPTLRVGLLTNLNDLHTLRPFTLMQIVALCQSSSAKPGKISPDPIGYRTCIQTFGDCRRRTDQAQFDDQARRH